MTTGGSSKRIADLEQRLATVYGSLRARSTVLNAGGAAPDISHVARERRFDPAITMAAAPPPGNRR
jgi:hypothetical protein